MFVQSTLHPCSDRCDSYHQALHDFNVVNLIDTIRNLCTSDSDVEWMPLNASELESLAALLIQQLTLSLQSQVIAEYFQVLHRGVHDLPTFELKSFPHFTALPKHFPKQTPVPKFADGSEVGWISLSENSEIQTGVILGHFYAYARHLRQWTWKYLVWLRQPLGQVMADTAWEDDLKWWNGESCHD